MNDYNFNAKDAANKCISWIQEWFKENGSGPSCKAVVGISGGKDSSVVASLCVNALGSYKVLGVIMPDGYQNDIDDSYELVEFLEIESLEIDISKSVNSIKDAVTNVVPDWTDQASINLPARVRMATLYAVSQCYDGRVANTCNLSEDWIGYSTRYGDAAGDFAPLQGFTVNEVKQIGKELKLPDHLIDKAPSDGLCGYSDEDKLGFTYDILDKYIRGGIEPERNVKEIIDKLHYANRFKLQPIPYFRYFQ